MIAEDRLGELWEVNDYMMVTVKNRTRKMLFRHLICFHVPR